MVSVVVIGSTGGTALAATDNAPEVPHEPDDLPALVTLDLLLKHRVDVFQSSKVYENLGGRRKTWVYGTVFEPLADHGYSCYEWATYADMEILSMAKMILLGRDPAGEGNAMVEQAVDLRQSKQFAYGLFRTIHAVQANWPRIAPSEDRLAFLSGLLGRILVNPRKPRHIWGQDFGRVLCAAIPDDPLLLDIEIAAKGALETYSSPRSKDLGIGNLLDVWVFLEMSGALKRGGEVLKRAEPRLWREIFDDNEGV